MCNIFIFNFYFENAQKNIMKSATLKNLIQYKEKMLTDKATIKS